MADLAEETENVPTYVQGGAKVSTPYVRKFNKAYKIYGRVYYRNFFTNGKMICQDICKVC